MYEQIVDKHVANQNSGIGSAALTKMDVIWQPVFGAISMMLELALWAQLIARQLELPDFSTLSGELFDIKANDQSRTNILIGKLSV